MPRYVPPHLRKKRQNQAKQKVENTTPKEKKVLTSFGQLAVIFVDITNPSGKEACSLKNDPHFARAYIQCKLKQQKDDVVQFYWVIDKTSRMTVEMGPPEDWDCGIANMLLQGQVEVKVIRAGRTKVKRQIRHRGHLGRYRSDTPLRKRRGASKEGHFTAYLKMCCRTEPGPLPYQEDRYQILDDLQRFKPNWNPSTYKKHPKLVYASVFDGHGGTSCADEASRHLHKHIAKYINKQDDLCGAIVRGFLQFDKEFCEFAKTKHDSSGAVAAVAIIEGNTLYVANIGDCAVVLCRAGDTILLSDEHPLTTCEAERKRVLGEGAYISSDGRLNGDLAVSRAFGDVQFSDDAEPSKIPGLSCRPVVKKYFLSEEDEFLIVGCDGIFDYVNYKNSVQAIRRNLRRYNCIERAATRLVQFAQKVPSMDNMTCVLVAFPKPGKDGELVIVKPRTSHKLRVSDAEGVTAKKRRRFDFSPLLTALDVEDKLKPPSLSSWCNELRRLSPKMDSVPLPPLHSNIGEQFRKSMSTEARRSPQNKMKKSMSPGQSLRPPPSPQMVVIEDHVPSPHLTMQTSPTVPTSSPLPNSHSSPRKVPSPRKY